LIRRNRYIFVLAALFLGVAHLLARFDFWGFAGLGKPHGYEIQGILFLALLLVLQNGLFGPYLSVLEERESQTVRKRADAEKTRLDADRMLGEYRQAIEAARVRATAERERVALEAEAVERERVRAAKEAAGGELEAAVGRLESEASAARDQLRGQVDPLAAEIADRALRGRIGGRAKTPPPTPAFEAKKF
jgi:F0F1-type ATP synthase membrane subunit b/b'